MRIDYLKITSPFKNLEGFEIDIHEQSMETVLLGLNATGKSNFIEALVIIFRDLDLERDPIVHDQKKEKLGYYIRYERNSEDKKTKHHIIIEFDTTPRKGYSFTVDGKNVSKKEFWQKKEHYLPRHVFVYYSGLNNRMEELFHPHRLKYFHALTSKDAKYEEFDRLPPLFLVEEIHASFALISFFIFQESENETLEFLKEELGISEFASTLFKLKKPSWADSLIKRHGPDPYWHADGLVRRVIADLNRFALAPIRAKESISSNYRKKETVERLYLYIKDENTLKNFAGLKHQNTIQLFNALNSLYVSDFVEKEDIIVNVFKKREDGELVMRELSEGEKQLLTVLGMLKFTKDEESLILLDEPDTHLNPLWKWKYLDYIDKVVKRPESTQIIFCTHDPLVIGSMEKEQVKIFRKQKSGKTIASSPSVSPSEMSVSKILTSELFGIPSIMGKKVEDSLNEKRFLQSKILNNKADEKDLNRFEKLKKYLDEIGFYETSIDSRYQKYLELLSEKMQFSKRNYTKEEEKELDRISREVMNEILKEEKDI